MAGKLVPDPFVFAKNSAQPPLENEIFKVIYVITCNMLCNNKAIKISLNQHVDLFRFLFTEDSLKIEKGLELVSKQHFSQKFLIKSFIL